jgi:hypothetical protein
VKRRWLRWLVYSLLAVVAFTIVVQPIGARIEARKAKDIALGVSTRGTPSDVLQTAQEAVSIWAHEPSVVIHTDPVRNGWDAVVMSGASCYGVKIRNSKVSSLPGMQPCPTIEVATTDDGQLDTSDTRRPVVSGFVDTWLRGAPYADRYLADTLPMLAPPTTLAKDVKVNAIYGKAVANDPGTRATVTATATVKFPSRIDKGPDQIESMAWTIDLVHGDERWSIERVTGGQVPDGDKADLKRGRTTDTTTPTQQGD